jgi:hypothetical protein
MRYGKNSAFAACSSDGYSYRPVFDICQTLEVKKHAFYRLTSFAFSNLLIYKGDNFLSLAGKLFGQLPVVFD